jgi:hypothetical protein
MAYPQDWQARPNKPEINPIQEWWAAQAKAEYQHITQPLDQRAPWAAAWQAGIRGVGSTGTSETLAGLIAGND